MGVPTALDPNETTGEALCMIFASPENVTLTAIGDLEVLADRWQGLEGRANGSFFLGWTWMGSWLSATGARPDLLTVSVGGRDMALGFIGRSFLSGPLGRTRALFLNQFGSGPADRVFVEYNGLLIDRDYSAQVVADLAFNHLAADNHWSVLRLAGMVASDPISQAGRFRRRMLAQELNAYFVDLRSVRAADGNYLSLLSANSRSQIRRSARDYGEGAVVIPDKAKSPEQVDEWLADMHHLNRDRHNDNAWEEPLFRAFARQLAICGLGNGEVELLRITAGEQLLGYLLNFVYRGRAMNYQSAFAPAISSKAKPGLMCHVAAVERYAMAGYDLYSLLAGGDRYKQSLATGHEVLQWWNLERFSPRLEAEHLLRKLLRRPVSA